MSNATQPEPADARKAPADVAQSLFWDDVRAGLKVVCVGVVLLLIGELCIQFRAHSVVSGAALIAGGVLSLVGLLICTAIPKETGARPAALTAAGCAALGLLALLVDLFNFLDLPVVGAIAVLLSAVALRLFAVVLRTAAVYLGHRPLTAAARQFVYVAMAFALFLVIIAFSGLAGIAAVRLLADLLAIGVVGIFVSIAWGTSESIQRTRLGHPLELPRRTVSPEYLAAEEQRLARENVTYHPGAPPHFSEEQVRFFHTDDAKAATAVVVLLAGIFIVGVVLYTIVAWSVAS
jgi:hypothetical protein